MPRKKIIEWTILTENRGTIEEIEEDKTYTIISLDIFFFVHGDGFAIFVLHLEIDLSINRTPFINGFAFPLWVNFYWKDYLSGMRWKLECCRSRARNHGPLQTAGWPQEPALLWVTARSSRARSAPASRNFTCSQYIAVLMSKGLLLFFF